MHFNLSRINPNRTFIPCFAKINFNISHIGLYPTARFPQMISSSRFYDQICVGIFHVSLVCQRPHSAIGTIDAQESNNEVKAHVASRLLNCGHLRCSNSDRILNGWPYLFCLMYVNALYWSVKRFYCPETNTSPFSPFRGPRNPLHWKLELSFYSLHPLRLKQEFLPNVDKTVIATQCQFFSNWI
jgi:hypothetical protein